MEVTQCVLTGYRFPISLNTSETTGSFFEYQLSPVGKVKIGFQTLISFINNSQYQHPILAGICRNAFEQNVEPPLITQTFIESELKNLQYPKSFEEKWRYFLKYIYDKGGNENKKFDFQSAVDYPICYAENIDEFNRIMDLLKKRYFIDWSNCDEFGQNLCVYIQVELTDIGIGEVKKDLPKIPLIGLVNQEITTGNIEIDEKINHAKKLFFEESQNKENMRSACEELNYVLEPLRNDVKKYFNNDVEDFFNLVNRFDIRHNKETTKKIEHVEQLEWIFYSLLNTINTYTKLKSRLE